MADPFALKCRAEELESARKRNESLRKLIIVIEATVVKTQSQHQAPSQLVTDSIKQCEAEIQSLEDCVAELAGCDRGTWRSKLQCTLVYQSRWERSESGTRPRTDIAANPSCAQNSKVQLEVQLGNAVDLQLLRCLGAYVGPAHTELLHPKAMLVFRDIYSDAAVADPAPVGPSVARHHLDRRHDLKMPPRLTDHVFVDVEVERLRAMIAVVFDWAATPAAAAQCSRTAKSGTRPKDKINPKSSTALGAKRDRYLFQQLLANRAPRHDQLKRRCDPIPTRWPPRLEPPPSHLVFFRILRIRRNDPPSRHGIRKRSLKRAVDRPPAHPGEAIVIVVLIIGTGDGRPLPVGVRPPRGPQVAPARDREGQPEAPGPVGGRDAPVLGRLELEQVLGGAARAAADGLAVAAGGDEAGRLPGHRRRDEPGFEVEVQLVSTGVLDGDVVQGALGHRRQLPGLPVAAHTEVGRVVLPAEEQVALRGVRQAALDEDLRRDAHEDVALVGDVVCGAVRPVGKRRLFPPSPEGLVRDAVLGSQGPVPLRELHERERERSPLGDAYSRRRDHVVFSIGAFE
ncbi:hypothetical protein PG997_002710 [Apiospora hydei]|uniref:Uncharacterized protein n=1 Tax=Apiospora hydei TaxID=1337664 RepID=A0ABR1WX60_9PEZI